MNTYRIVFWLTAAVCIGGATPFAINAIKSSYAWAFIVPCEIKNTCQEGEK